MGVLLQENKLDPIINFSIFVRERKLTPIYKPLRLGFREKVFSQLQDTSSFK